MNQIFQSTQFFNFINANTRLLLSIFFGLFVFLLIPNDLVEQTVTQFIIGWNAGAIIYLTTAFKMMFWSSHERMRERAIHNELGKNLLLFLVLDAAFICMVAIIVELGIAKNLDSQNRNLHMALVGLTIVSSWAFTHTMFAIHYAHEYYINEVRDLSGGLQFPGTAKPEYSDFLYFAFIIGTSSQTADVSFTNRSMRRIGIVHCVFTFLFNTTILALAINIASAFF